MKFSGCFAPGPARAATAANRHGLHKLLNEVILAKLVERAPDPEGETKTQESAFTEAGQMMGTVAYMSPEQASAKPLDQRTDIFSLGVMFYEMLSGARPFRGKSQVETMHAIIHDSAPPLIEFPPELEEILAKAMAG